MNSRLSNQRGAILIQVGVSILVLMGLMVFVFDNGLLWVARGQAQNAADAGALAGAVARAFDDFGNPPAAGGPAWTAATNVAAANNVWNQPGTSTVGWNCPPWITTGGCVQVEVFRDGTNGSTTLPQIFGPLMGVASHGVRAHAVAQAVAGNAVSCLKPWAVADKWLESTPPWTQLSTYDPAAGDSYVPPYGTSGTGFSRTDAQGNPIDLGMQLTLKLAHPGNGANTLSSGWAMSIDLPNAGGGAQQYENNITGCTTATVGVATQAEQCAAINLPAGCASVLTGGMTGPTAQGVSDLVAVDSTASWSTTLNRPVGGQGTNTPRIVPVAVFDTARYMAAGYNGTNGIIKIVNILGFFVEGLCSDNFYKEPYLDCSNNNNDVVGRLMGFSAL